MTGLEDLRRGGFAADQDDLESSDDEEVEPEPRENEEGGTEGYEGEDYDDDDEDMLEYEETIHETDALHPTALR